jgi:hypothetical protein
MPRSQHGKYARENRAQGVQNARHARLTALAVPALSLPFLLLFSLLSSSSVPLCVLCPVRSCVCAALGSFG